MKVFGFLAAVLGLSGAVLLVAADRTSLIGTPGLGRVQLAAICLGLAASGGGVWLWRQSGGGWRRLGIWGGLATLILTGLPVATLIAAERERGVGFVHDRTVGLRTVQRRVLDRVGWSGIGICRCVPDRELRIPMPGGFETTASLFLPPDRRGSADRLLPGVVLVHGNVWNARRVAPYRLWATRLAEAGYAVLVFDLIGFGDSDDPYGRGASGVTAAFDRVGQVKAAIAVLLLERSVDPSDLTIMGHSGGVDPAVAAGTSIPNVRGIVAMVSPPPPEEAALDELSPERAAYFETRAREQYTFIYGREAPADFYSEFSQESNPDYERGWARLREPTHPAFLLVLGERDQPGGHAFELTRLATLTEPASLLALPRADHYLNTAQSLGFIFYDRRLAETFIDGLANWFTQLR